MIKKKSRKYGKTIALIDAANIIYANKYLHWAIDHRKLIKYLKERYQSSIIIYYAGLEENDQEKRKFYQKLEKFGYITKIKPVAKYKGKIFWKSLHCPHCNRKFNQKFQGPPIKKANCDVILTLDAVRLISKYKTLLLFSGDGDFVSLVEYLQKMTRQVLVFSSKENCSRQLRKIANQFTELNFLKAILEEKK